jgi:hypothetical protein
MVGGWKGKETAVNQNTPSHLQHKSGRNMEAKKQVKIKEQTVVSKVKNSQKSMTSKALFLQVSSRLSTHQIPSLSTMVHSTIAKDVPNLSPSTTQVSELQNPPPFNQSTSQSRVSDLSNVSTRLTLVEDSVKDLTKKVGHNGSQLDEILDILRKDSGKKSAGCKWNK